MRLKLSLAIGFLLGLTLFIFHGFFSASPARADECTGTYRCYKYSSALNDCLQTTNSYSCSGSNYSSCVNSANNSTQTSCVKCGVKSSGCSWSYCGSSGQACCSWGCAGGLTCQEGICKTAPPACTPNTLYCSNGQEWWYNSSCQIVYGQTCTYGCNTAGTACGIPYCENTCDRCNFNGCTGTDCYRIHCWKNSSRNPGDALPDDCKTLSSCSTLCHPTVDTCQTPPSINCPALGYPGQVAHIDNCGGVGCGAPCGGGGGGGCTATLPSNITVTPVSPTKATVSWTPGNGTQQQLRVGGNLTEVNGGCPGLNSPACVVNETNLPMSQTSYTTGNVLTPGTVYYWEVVSYNSSSCSAGSTRAAVSSCTLSPSVINLTAGDSTTVTASVNSSPEILRTDFASGNTGIATVNPASDPTYIYQTLVNAIAQGSTNITGNVYLTGGSLGCTSSAPITVTPPSPWWQVKDADITTNGDLVSSIPSSCVLPACNPVLGLKGDGGFPGVPLFAGAADFQSGAGVGKAAEDPYNWQANSTYASGRTYNFNYFKGQIPPDVVFTEIDSGSVNGGFFNSGGTPSRGYIWYHFNGAALGDLTITGNVNLVGDRKVVLLVEGTNLNVNGLINLQNKGFGFFMAIVGKDATGFKGNIVIDPSVTHPNQPALEGIFLAEGQIRTGASANKLYLRGSFVAYDGFLLQRNLAIANANTPAELFEYSPSIMTTFPRVFTQRRMRWKEVAP